MTWAHVDAVFGGRPRGNSHCAEVLGKQYMQMRRKQCELLLELVRTILHIIIIISYRDVCVCVCRHSLVIVGRRFQNRITYYYYITLYKHNGHCRYFSHI